MAINLKDIPDAVKAYLDTKVRVIRVDIIPQGNYSGPSIVARPGAFSL